MCFPTCALACASSAATEPLLYPFVFAPKQLEHSATVRSAGSDGPPVPTLSANVLCEVGGPGSPDGLELNLTHPSAYYSGTPCFAPPMERAGDAGTDTVAHAAPTLLISDPGGGRVVEMDVRTVPPTYLGSPVTVPCPFGVAASPALIAVTAHDNMVHLFTRQDGTQLWQVRQTVSGACHATLQCVIVQPWPK